MHCDETDDPASRHVETLARETERLGLKGPGRRLAPHLHALHGQPLRRQAPAPPPGGGAHGDRQPLDQHRHPGPAGHLSEAPRDDPGEGDGRGRHPGRARPRLRDGPLVRPRQPRHAGGRPHGGARRPHDRGGRDADPLRGGHHHRGGGPASRGLRARARLPRRPRRAPGARSGGGDPPSRHPAPRAPPRRGHRPHGARGGCPHPRLDPPDGRLPGRRGPCRGSRAPPPAPGFGGEPGGRCGRPDTLRPPPARTTFPAHAGMDRLTRPRTALPRLRGASGGQRPRPCRHSNRSGACAGEGRSGAGRVQPACGKNPTCIHRATGGYRGLQDGKKACRVFLGRAGVSFSQPTKGTWDLFRKPHGDEATSPCPFPRRLAGTPQPRRGIS